MALVLDKLKRLYELGAEFEPGVLWVGCTGGGAHICSNRSG